MVHVSYAPFFTFCHFDFDVVAAQQQQNEEQSFPPVAGKLGEVKFPW